MSLALGGTTHTLGNGPGAPPMAAALSVFWQAPLFIGIGVSEILCSVPAMEFFYANAPARMKAVCAAHGVVPPAKRRLHAFVTGCGPGYFVWRDDGAAPRVTLGTAVTAAAVDPDANVAYLGTSSVPARVVKVDLTSMTRLGALTPEAREAERRRSMRIGATSRTRARRAVTTTGGGMTTNELINE